MPADAQPGAFALDELQYALFLSITEWVDVSQAMLYLDHAGCIQGQRWNCAEPFCKVDAAMIDVPARACAGQRHLDLGDKQCFEWVCLQANEDGHRRYKCAERGAILTIDREIGAETERLDFAIFAVVQSDLTRTDLVRTGLAPGMVNEQQTRRIRGSWLRGIALILDRSGVGLVRHKVSHSSDIHMGKPANRENRTSSRGRAPQRLHCPQP